MIMNTKEYKQYIDKNFHKLENSKKDFKLTLIHSKRTSLYNLIQKIYNKKFIQNINLL